MSYIVYWFPIYDPSSLVVVSFVRYKRLYVRYLTVLVGPDDVFLTPSTRNYIKDEHSNLTVLCSGQCWPPCSYQWTGPNSYNQIESELHLTDLTKFSAGIYKCKVTNLRLNSEQSTNITLNVRCKLYNTFYFFNIFST